MTKRINNINDAVSHLVSMGWVELRLRELEDLFPELEFSGGRIVTITDRATGEVEQMTFVELFSIVNDKPLLDVHTGLIRQTRLIRTPLWNSLY